MPAHVPIDRVNVRPEEPHDVEAVHRLNRLAFGSEEEAVLVDVLRAGGKITLALVAEHLDRVVGHIVFSPMTFEPARDRLSPVGLAPMAVLPDFQRQGIGSLLVESGLEACRVSGHDCVFVLGHPDYYPRFGFRPASSFDVRSSYDVPDEAFMALELRPGALSGVSGVVRYQPEFDGI